MKGISEERLKSLYGEYQTPMESNLILMLLKGCEELNDWKPIDNNTPKDRRILLFDKTHGVVIGLWFEENWVSSMVIMHDVTHWQELPTLPKEKL